MDRRTKIPTDISRGTQADRWKHQPKDRQIYQQTDRQTEGQTDQNTDRYTNIQTGRQKEIPTDISADRPNRKTYQPQKNDQRQTEQNTDRYINGQTTKRHTDQKIKQIKILTNRMKPTEKLSYKQNDKHIDKLKK